MKKTIHTSKGNVVFYSVGEPIRGIPATPQTALEAADLACYEAGLSMDAAWNTYINNANATTYNAYVDASIRFEALSEVADSLA